MNRIWLYIKDHPLVWLLAILGSLASIAGWYGSDHDPAQSAVESAVYATVQEVARQSMPVRRSPGGSHHMDDYSTVCLRLINTNEQEIEVLSASLLLNAVEVKSMPRNTVMTAVSIQRIDHTDHTTVDLTDTPKTGDSIAVRFEDRPVSEANSHCDIWIWIRWHTEDANELFNAKGRVRFTLDIGGTNQLVTSDEFAVVVHRWQNVATTTVGQDI